ncbi:uncharacterized protein LOC100176816 isoform X3 [Ciona intestinalis]
MTCQSQPESLETQCMLKLYLSIKDFTPDQQSEELKQHFEKLRKGFSDCYETVTPNNSGIEFSCLSGQGKQKLSENAILQKLQSFLVIVNVRTQICIHVSDNISSFTGFSKISTVGNSLDKILHSNASALEKNFATIKGPDESKKPSPHFFTGNFLTKLKESGGGNSVSEEGRYKEMKCVTIVDIFQDPPDCEETSNESKPQYYVCLVTPDEKTDPPTKGPPNQTIHTKGEIPQPEKFTTQQDIAGKIIALDAQHLLPSSSNQLQPPKKNDLIRRCIRSLFEPRQNGNSLSQILHSQVLNQGHATSPAYKFRLSDGTTVTAQTKSKLMQGKQGGDPPFIISLHSIYRDGTLQGLNLPGLPPAIKSILSGPVLLDRSSTSSPTIASTFTDSTSIQPFVQLSQNKKNQLPVEVSFSSNWSSSVAEGFHQRNGSEVARELLVSTGTKESAENIVNEVLSPPPHLDGHLVHSVGGAKSQLKSLLSSNSEKSDITMFETELNQTHSPTIGFIQKLSSVDNSYTNPATYPGPPCVDISRFSLPQDNGRFPSAPMSNESAISEGSVGNFLQKSQENLKATQSNGVHGARRVFTPPENQSAPTVTPRSRSASSTTFSSSENPLKRTVSMTTSETSPGGLMLSPGKQRDTKPAKRSKILETILNSTTINEAVISYACDVKPHTYVTAPVSILNHHTSNSQSVSVKTEVVATNCAPLPTISPQTLFDPLGTLTHSIEGKYPDPSDPTLENAPKWAASSAVSPEELEELNEIFNDLDSMNNEIGGDFSAAIDNSSSNQIQIFQSGLPQSTINHTMPAIEDQNHQPKLQYNNNMHHNMSPKQQHMPPTYSPPDPQIYPQQPHPNPMSTVVPTGLETCPNRVIPNPTPQHYTQPQSFGGDTQFLGGSDSWDGDEPFVDLGTYPPPAGINPRMPIPMQHNMGSMHINGGRMSGHNAMTNPMQGAPVTQRFPVNVQSQSMLHNHCVSHSNNRQYQYNGGGPHFDGVSNGGVSQYPYHLQGVKTDMTHSGIIAQKRNEHFMKQRRLQQQLQCAGTNSGGQNTYNNFFGNSHRVMLSPRGQQMSTPQYQPHVNTYRPQTQIHESLYRHQLPVPSLQAPMTTSPPVTNSYNGVVGMPMTSQAVTSPVPTTKTTPKRARTRKPRRSSKSKAAEAKPMTSSGDTIFWNDVTQNQTPPLYRAPAATAMTSQPKVFQMTFRDKHQRPQATYNDSFATTSADGASWSIHPPSPGLKSVANSSVTSQNNTQNLNLNVLLRQFSSKSEGRDMNNNTVPPSLATPTGFNEPPPFTSPDTHCDLIKNSNLNNNTKPCRFVASVTATTISSPAYDVTSAADTPVTSSEGGRQKVSLLESLLLSKDD